MTEGITVVDDQIKCAVAGMMIDVAMTPDEMRGAALALALLADKIEGKESPAIARFIDGQTEGSA